MLDLEDNVTLDTQDFRRFSHILNLVTQLETQEGERNPSKDLNEDFSTLKYQDK